MAETTPIFDEIHRFMTGVTKGVQDLKPVFNNVSIGIEAVSTEWEKANAAWRRKKDQLNKETPKIAKAFEEVGKAFEGWHVHIEDWGRQFDKNQRLMGIEFQTPAELRRQTHREKRRKERENCLHGRSPFPIHMGLGVTLKCPQCYGFTVYVGPERLFCYLCGWSRWRIGKRPRGVRFKNG